MVGVGKSLALPVGEAPGHRIPDEMFNGDRVAVDAQEIEGVGFTPYSRGNRGARFDNQRRPSADVVTLCGGSSERDVQVTGEKHVNAFARKLLDRFRTWTRASKWRAGMWLVERMVGHQNTNYGRRELLEQMENAAQLAPPDSSAADGERARRIRANQGDFIVDLKRREVVGHVPTVLTQRTEEPGEHVVQRHIVVAGHEQLRLRQGVEECAGGLELPRTSAFRKVSRYDQHVRSKRSHRLLKSLCDDRIDPAVVKADFERAGFKLEAESDLLRNPADDHSLLVFDEKIRGKTDRFVYRFRKPQ